MLKIDHITIKFGGLVANNDVCTEIQKGQIFGLIGKTVRIASSALPSTQATWATWC